MILSFMLHRRETEAVLESQDGELGRRHAMLSDERPRFKSYLYFFMISPQLVAG